MASTNGIPFPNMGSGSETRHTADADPSPSKGTPDVEKPPPRRSSRLLGKPIVDYRSDSETDSIQYDDDDGELQ